MAEEPVIKKGSKTKDGAITITFEGYDSVEQIMERLKYTFTPDAIAAITRMGLKRGTDERGGENFTVRTCTCCGFGGGGGCGHCDCDETCYPGT